MALLYEPPLLLSDIDVSLWNYSNHTNLWVRRPDHEIALKTLGLLPIMLTGIVANIAIIVVFTRMKGMRTSTNIFICNMAVADLMTILCCSWTIIIVDAHQNFVMGRVYCKLDGFFHVTFLLSSVFSLTIVSGDRLLGIVFPFSRRLGRAQALVIVLAAWVTAMVCASPTAIFRWLLSRKWNDYEEVWCNENGFILKFYWLIILILLVYVPLTVMAVAYTVIILQLDKYEHQLFLRGHPLKMKYRRKVIKVLFMYVLNYLLFWALFQVVVLYRCFKPPQKELPPWFRQVYFTAHVLTYAQSAINPLIYGLCNESFRKAFKMTFGGIAICCKKRKSRVAPADPHGFQSPLKRRRRPEVVEENEGVQNQHPATEHREMNTNF